MITDTPSDGTLFTDSTSLVCLALDTEVHDMIAANSTVLDNNVPRPQSYGVPLLNLKSGFLAGSVGRFSLGDRLRVLHINVGHGFFEFFGRTVGFAGSRGYGGSVEP